MPCIREPSRARMSVSKERLRSPAGYLRKTGDADMLDRRLGDLYDKYLKPSPCEIEKAAQAGHRVGWKGALAASVAAVSAPAVPIGHRRVSGLGTEGRQDSYGGTARRQGRADHRSGKGTGP